MVGVHPVSHGLGVDARGRDPWVLADHAGQDKVRVASVRVAEQRLEGRDLTRPRNIHVVPRKLDEGGVFEVGGEVISNMLSVIGGAEIEGVEATMKIVASYLRIVLVQVERHDLLDLCSEGQRFEGQPGLRLKGLYSRSARVGGLLLDRLGHCTCQSQGQSYSEGIWVKQCSGIGGAVRESCRGGGVETALVGVVLVECYNESRSIRSRKHIVRWRAYRQVGWTSMSTQRFRRKTRRRALEPLSE